MSLQIRNAAPEDVPLILQLIRELAEYEKLSHEATATESGIRKSLFSDNPHAFCIIAEINGSPAGFALYFYNFSTFVGKPGLYLEDLYVMPEFRKQGIGKQLLIELAKIAVEKGCGRFEWSVLDWNTPAIDFYKSLGARPMDGWTVFRVDGERLSELAAL